MSRNNIEGLYEGSPTPSTCEGFSRKDDMIGIPKAQMQLTALPRASRFPPHPHLMLSFKKDGEFLFA